MAGAIAALYPAPGVAQERDAAKAATMPAPAAAATPTPVTAPPIITRRSGTFGGRRVSYEALVEETVVPNGRGVPSAIVSSFAYVERRAKSDPTRPVLFAFNGGPGSASLWMHLGFLGPRRVDFPDPVNPPTVAPFALADNPHAPLDVADVVMIDPPLTGFSRMLPGARPEDFLGIGSDARAIADFIRQWLTRHGRWNSPKYVIGESYGTVRAIALAGALAGGVFPPNGSLGAVNLNGIAILGPAFGVGGARMEGNDRGSLTDLPSMVATAWYHRRLGARDQSLEAAIEAAREFAREDYLEALNAGYLLEPAERDRVAARLAALTGLPASAWAAANLRLPMSAFQAQLLGTEGRTVGAYDSRYVLQTRPAGNDPVVDDPAMGQYTPGFVGAMNHYLAAELGVRTSARYVPIAWTDVNFKWDYGAGPGVPQPRNDATELAIAMRRNPALRVFVGVGYYDLVTTLGAAEYALAHSPMARERLVLKGYPSGHMPYLGEDSAAVLAADLRSFLRGGLPATTAPPAAAPAARP
jgi:carboxypeptidase C (cathepsin A)